MCGRDTTISKQGTDRVTFFVKKEKFWTKAIKLAHWPKRSPEFNNGHDGIYYHSAN